LVNVSQISGAFASPPVTRLIRALAGLCVGVITILSLLPGDERPHTGMPGQFEHFFAYAGTGFLFGLGFAESRRIRLVIWGAMAAASVAFEGLQFFVPDRSPSLLDALASTLGLSFGLVAAALAFPILKKWLAFALRR
jgi:VanZ family protein